MKNKKLFSFLNLLVLSTQIAHASMPQWSYDAGPDPKTKLGKEIIDLVAAIPNMPEVSMKIMADQKFRPAFGPVNWRMLQGKNKVKILFIGQDATHIAEAAGRTATAGFGGRAQDLAAYFGVNEGAAFINTFAYTIQGQYGAYQTPYVLRGQGKDTLRFGNFVDNELWLMSQDQASPMVKWRNDLIDWIIRNNKDSIKLIVTFGGAARDAVATYIESKGAKVGAAHENEIKNIQIAETGMVYAGGNNEFPIVLDENGKDLYAKLMGRKIDYTKPEEQEAVKKDITENFETYKSKMIFTKGGPNKNGLLNPAQIDGYDLDKIHLNGQNTRSLRGMKLKDGSNVTTELLVVELPHPTFLSNMTPPEASKKVAENLKEIQPYTEKGWKITADPGMTNSYANGQAYKYARKDIGPEYYDFGTPGTRMVPVSSASRMSGNSHVIVFGTRERAKFDNKTIEAMTKALPAESFSADELFVARPRSTALRYIFDAGPGEAYAKIMKENLDLKLIFKEKSGKTEAKDGIEAFIVKSSPENADFGHYRGTFNSPKVIIVADPHGYDDLITSRALTGTRGQFLHRMMVDAGINDKYLVLKTVPFGMDKASTEDWDQTLKITEEYRTKLLLAVMNESKPSMIIADGINAQKEVARILKGSAVKIINMDRSGDDSADVKSVAKVLGANLSGEMANIPRSHLSFYARVWEGTSGDRVLAAYDGYRGFAFAEVAPAWAWNQQQNFKTDPNDNVDELLKKLEESNLPMPGEKIPQFLKRVDVDPVLSMILNFININQISFLITSSR
jgi:hypothetical protein